MSLPDMGPAPPPLAPCAAAIRRAAVPLAAPGACAESAAVAAVRVYALLTRLPGLGAATETRLPPPAAAPDGGPAWPARWPEEPRAALEGDDPFLLTIDAAGGDYLREMCPRDYEVLGDVAALPERLTSLYRDLTAGARPARPTAAAPLERKEHR